MSHAPQDQGRPEGRVVTVFRSRLRSGAAASYRELAAAVADRARTMPGYVEHKSFTADDGERVTIVVFDSRDHHDAWARDPEHVTAQGRGRAELYAEYSVTVCEERSHRAWQAAGAAERAPAAGAGVRTPEAPPEAPAGSSSGGRL